MKWVMHDCSDASMELSKDGIIMKDYSKDEANNHWCMIMEKCLQIGMKFLLINCHFDEKLMKVIKEHNICLNIHNHVD